MNSKFSTAIPMFIIFDNKLRPKKASATRYSLEMNIDDMLLYTNVMRMYVNGIYYGDRIKGAQFDMLWQSVYKRFEAIETSTDVSLFKKIMVGINSIYEFIQNNFSSGVSFIHETMGHKWNSVRAPSKDKYDVFEFLWEETDRMLFDIPIVDNIIMILLILTKMIVIHSISDPDERSVITSNWSGSYIINYVCNNDRKYSEFCKETFADAHVYKAISGIMRRNKIPMIATAGDATTVCSWFKNRYLKSRIRGAGAADTRRAVLDKIDSYLKSTYRTDDRHKIIFEMWFVVNAVFDTNVSEDVWSELEITKIQHVVRENNAIDVLRKVRNTLRENDMIAVNNDNISSFMDLDLYALAIKMIGDMCSSINNEKSNKDRKYVMA